jgi:hypothetical protein
VRRTLVKQLQSPCTKKVSGTLGLRGRHVFAQGVGFQTPFLGKADLLWDFGTPDEIPALEAAVKKAQQSGDRELEQQCNRALERLRRQ